MKIKSLTKEQLIISADRLTRFKEPEIKYLRVFKDLILNNLIEPQYKKSDLDEMDYEKLTKLAEEIINSSLDCEPDLSINQKLFDYEKTVFNFNNNVEKLLKNRINYNGIINILPYDIPDNLKFLKSLYIKTDEKFVFPIKKVILCEGITEEILLPEFAKICGHDFREHGIYMVSAGGKNQVVKYFYNYVDCIKIPIFILLDNDAKENLAQIMPKLRDIDKIHLVKSGEFEDLLTRKLIIKTLNYVTQNISSAPIGDLEKTTSTVEFLENFFKHRGLHEFKKADFANSVKQNITDINDVSPEIKEIINDIKIM